MIKNNNFEFDVTVSNTSFSEKPNSIQISKIVWTQETVNTDKLINKFCNGYAISNVYNQPTLTATNRTYKNFIGGFVVYIDVDYTNETDMYKYIEKLNHKPTFGYYSFSDNKTKNGITSRRFRLGYVFNEIINDVEDFKKLSKNVLNSVEKDTDEEMDDTCTISPNQYMNGTNNNEEVYISYSVYDKEDFRNENENEKFNKNEINKETTKTTNENKKCKPNYIKEKENNIIKFGLHFSETEEKFITDFFSLSFQDLLDKYSNIYHFTNNTPLPEVDEDTMYILLPDDYCEIKRYWVMQQKEDDYGETRWFPSYVRRIKDGENRKRKLFINGCYRRKMNNNISFCEMLYCLCYELYYFCENNKDVITNKKLFDITANVMQADWQKYTTDTPHPQFIVNIKYCVKYGITKKQAANLARKQIQYEKIGLLYDCSLTDKENLKVMKENGVNICLRTLQNFKKDNGIQKNKKHNNTGVVKEDKEEVKKEDLQYKITTANEINVLTNDGEKIQNIIYNMDWLPSIMEYNYEAI